jgi:hypothetical protein
MSIFKKYLVTTTVMLLLLVTNACYSQQEGAKAAKKLTPAEAVAKLNAQEDVWITDGHELGPWWHKNPGFFDPLPRPLLYHLEANISYSKHSGNIDSDDRNAKVGLVLRKDLFTSITTFTLTKKELTKKFTEVETAADAYLFREGLRYALFDKMSAVIGFTKDRNTGKYIDDRFTYFVGARGTFIDEPTLHLWLSGYYGFNEKISFYNREVQKVPKYKDFPSVKDYDSNAVSLMQELDWKINDMTTFKEDFEYTKMLDDDYSHWKLSLELGFKLTERTSFITSYSFDYDENLFTDTLKKYLDKRTALGKPSGEVEKMDTGFTVGIKIVF